jgi:hypothetical protein
VTISNLTVDGTGNGVFSCGLDIQGILFQNASGTLNHVAVRNQVPNSGFGGCQIGESIYVQTAASQTSSLTVENSSVHNSNKNGITGNDAGTTLIVSGSYVQGAGVVASGGAAQNGIQLAFGATGKVSSSTVIDNIYGDPTVAASAGLKQLAPGTEVSGEAYLVIDHVQLIEAHSGDSPDIAHDVLFEVTEDDWVITSTDVRKVLVIVVLITTDLVRHPNG